MRNNETGSVRRLVSGSRMAKSVSMPSDAKFGLIVGMIVVLLMSLLFFRKEGTGVLPAAAPAPANPPIARPLRTEPKIQLPQIEPPPRFTPAPAKEDLPELPPPAFDVVPLPPPAVTRL
jgi:hypothetical protein